MHPAIDKTYLQLLHQKGIDNWFWSMFNLMPGMFSSRSVFHTKVKDGNNKSKLLRCTNHQYDPAPEDFSSALKAVFVSLVMTIEWRGLKGVDDTRHRVMLWSCLQGKPSTLHRETIGQRLPLEYRWWPTWTPYVSLYSSFRGQLITVIDFVDRVWTFPRR